jgi:general stress protein 26
MSALLSSIPENAPICRSPRAHVSLDRSLAARIWRSTDNAWWTGPDDPDVCVLKVEPLTAELWDGPASKAATVFELLKARLTGNAPDIGENRKITVDMQG